MPSGDPRVLSAIRDLIRTCRNGQKGFCTAVEGVTDGNLAQLFRGIAAQRGRFAAELEKAANDLRDLVATEDSRPEPSRDAVSRGWIHIRSALGREDEGGLLFECGRGERAAVRSYQEALMAQLPATLDAMVRRQYEEVKEAYEKIRSLEKLN